MRRRRRSGVRGYELDKRSEALIRYWTLTMLLQLGGHREFFNGMRGFSDDSVAYFLGLEAYIDEYNAENRPAVMRELKEMYEPIKEMKTGTYPKRLKSNIKKLAGLIGLDRVERDVLAFGIFLHYHDLLKDAARTLDDLSSEKTVQVLSVLLDHSPRKIKKALSPEGKLTRSGLISIDRSGSAQLNNKLDLLSFEFADKMMTLDDSIEEMIRDSVRRCAPAELSLEDYDYLKKDLDVMVPYLKSAMQQQMHGVNVLLYGVPGTGKTELTKALADTLGVKLYEVSYADDEDSPITGERRLKAYKVAQSFFAGHPVMMMFDEIEDVTSDRDALNFFTPPKQNNKGWMNRMLETNPVPTVWITNDILSMDRAMLRRFDIALELPVPPKRKREEIIRKHCGDLVGEKTINTISGSETVAPALVTRAAKVIASAEEIEDKDEAFTHLIDQTLQAQGYPGIKPANSTLSLPKSYDPTLINTDTDLEALAEGIKRNPNARLCFYGVPGTGKSAYGRWLAQYLDKPFLLKKGSDLISMWVGGTEKNIANAFREAKEEGAVLVFDEVDSFLQDRRSAQRSWEVTQVNEMLVQMENYDGIFIATTNLMSGLDQASIRRFDMKLEFRYLKPEQAWRLFKKECRAMGIEDSFDKKLQTKVKTLKHIAPGDFAAIRRQSRFKPVESAQMLLERLQEELAVKEQGNSAVMGFVRV